jgi:predicted nucleic acid-binding protein
MRIVVDTDIIVDVLRKFEPTIKLLEKLVDEHELLISGITESEIFAGKDMQHPEKRRKVINFLEKFKKVNPDNQILKKAGEFRRKYNISLLDCIVAATTFMNKAKLLTKNIKDFETMEEISLLKI